MLIYCLYCDLRDYLIKYDSYSKKRVALIEIITVNDFLRTLSGKVG